MKALLYGFLLSVIAGCLSFSSTDTRNTAQDAAVAHSAGAISGAATGASIDATWAILPVITQPTTAGAVASTAAESAMALTEAHLNARGIRSIVSANAQDATLIDPATARYAVQTTVYEWQYVKGLNRKPRVRLRLDVTDTDTQTIVHSGTFADAGRERSTIVATANRGVGRMLAGMPLVSTPQLVAGPSQLANVEDHTHLSDEALLEQVLTADFGQSGNHSTVSGALRTGSTDTGATPEYRLATADGLLPASIRDTSVAVFYDANPPIEILSQFDRLILESANIKPTDLQALTANGATTYAYFSIGEVGPDRVYSEPVNEQWVASVNSAWNSRVMDLTSAGWQQFVIRRIDELVAQGFDGVFLDTMDSFQLISTDDTVRQNQQQALAGIIASMKKRHPSLRLIANRGFEVLDSIAPHLDAIAAESLYKGWNNARQRYVDVPAADREWLTGWLDTASQTYGLDVIVIDYLPPSERDDAVAVAQRIAQQGYIPWVATPGLDYVGVGTLDVKPRQVMLMFDSTVDGALPDSPIHKLLAMPLEYYGYVPVYHDIATDGLPNRMQRDRLAGIVTYGYDAYDQPQLSTWIDAQVNDGVPLLMFGKPAADLSATTLQTIGLEPVRGFDFRSSKLTVAGPITQFEKRLLPRLTAVTFPVRNTGADNTVHVQYSDAQGDSLDVAVTGPWGGYVAIEAAINIDVELNASWRLNPFELIETAFAITPMPMPDVTTENGRRLWLSHIDGDALPSWAEMPGPKRLGAEVIKTDILERFPVPHTISVVEGEMVGIDNHADRRDRMFRVAKDIFSLPNVELASHTYSHPYDWVALKENEPSGLYNLPIDGYRFNIERELGGSMDFINRELAPKGKQANMVLWSGAALPEENALQYAAEQGFLNMNGGFTTMSRANPTVAAVGPMARPVGEHIQVYAPILNENVYTNDWLGPFDGFRRVIETLEMTEHPRRLKPINIYYHFYAGTKRSSMVALSEVYHWSMRQDAHPVYGSYYAAKVPDARKAGVARYLDGRWKLSNLGNIRSFRVAGATAWADTVNSQGVIGSTALHDGSYLHTDGSNTVTLSTQTTQPVNPYLVSANGVVTQWAQTSQGLTFRVQGHVPVVLEIGGVKSGQCTVSFAGGAVSGTEVPQATQHGHSVMRQSVTRYQFKTQDTGHAKLDCHA